MKIYLDTLVIFALFDDRNPERKALTEDFFSKIETYNTYISEFTVAEIERTPDQILRNKMREAIKRFSVFEINKSVEELAKE